MIILKLNDCEGIYFPPELGKVSNFASLISFAKTTKHLFINLKIYDRAFDMLKPYFHIKNNNRKRSKDHNQFIYPVRKNYIELCRNYSLSTKQIENCQNVKYMQNSINSINAIHDLSRSQQFTCRNKITWLGRIWRRIPFLRQYLNQSHSSLGLPGKTVFTKQRFRL